MWGLVAKFVEAWADIVPRILAWWDKHTREQEQTEKDTRVSDIRANSADEFLRRVKPNGNPNPGEVSANNAGAAERGKDA